MADHDQRFKNLIHEFLREFIGLFFPDLPARLDLQSVDWEEKEVFSDPPQGDVYHLDLVARIPSSSKGAAANLVHVEIESRDAVATFRPRLYNYYHFLRHRHRCPVISLAVYLRVGLEGVGLDSYVEEDNGLEVLRFQFRYVGLPGLEAAQYVAGNNWLGVALAALMRMPREGKAGMRAEALRRLLLECQENNYRRFLLVECVEAYLELDEQQKQDYERILLTNPYKEIGPMMQTTYEKGIESGKRRMVETQLTKKFGPLPEPVKQRLAEMPITELEELGSALLDAATLQALGLVD
jgi:Domain of unknown function (DUF4351)